MLFNLIATFLVLLVPFSVGLTLYRGGGRWKGVGATLMGVPVALVVLLLLFLLFAAAWPFPGR